MHLAHPHTYIYTALLSRFFIAVALTFFHPLLRYLLDFRSTHPDVFIHTIFSRGRIFVMTWAYTFYLYSKWRGCFNDLQRKRNVPIKRAWKTKENLLSHLIDTTSIISNVSLTITKNKKKRNIQVKYQRKQFSCPDWGRVILLLLFCNVTQKA